MNEMTTTEPHVLIIEATFYPEIADELAAGAIATLNDAGVTYERIKVPGALEIPSVVRYAVKSMQLFCGNDRFDGFVALGCVIRGDTSHYDHVCDNAIGGLSRLATEYALAIGNGVLTVENRAQAMARASVAQGNKGGVAAQACIEMVQLKSRFGLLRK